MYDPNPMAADQPEPFSAAPQTGGKMLPMTSASRGGSDAERQQMLENMSRIKSDSPAGIEEFYKDGTVDWQAYGRGNRSPTMDSAADFYRRFPEARRIRCL
jgi:hypothetical protein